MFKQSANQAHLDKISKYCMYINYEDGWISVTVLTKKYAVTTLHCIPEPARVLGQSLPVVDSRGERLQLAIHGIDKQSDYAVLKMENEEFFEAPYIVCPETFDKYLVVGYDFGEKKPLVQIGNVSSLDSTGLGLFYGDSGCLPGFSGGGVFFARNCALMGIVRGSYWNGKRTHQNADVLEMISVQVMLRTIMVFRDEPFSI